MKLPVSGVGVQSVPRRTSRRRLRLRSQLSGWGVLLILVVLIIPPGIIMAKEALVSGGHLTLGAFRSILHNPDLWPEAANTLIFSVGSALWAIILGGPIAWIIERSQTRLRGIVYTTAFITFAFPGVLKAVGWILVAGPKTGLVNQALHALHIPLTFNVFTMWGMIFVEGLMWAPVAIQLMGVTFQHMDPQLEDSASMSGASFGQRIFHITMPMALPSILGVALLVAIWDMQTFEVPLLIGIPSKITLFSISISNSIMYNLPPNYAEACAYGIVISTVVIAAIFLYRYLLRQSDRFVTVGGKGFRPKPIDLGKWQVVADILCWCFVALEVVVPVYLVVLSFLPGFGIQSPLSKLSFGNYRAALQSPGLISAFWNSVTVSVATAVGTVLLGFVVSWTVLRSRFKLKGLVDYLANMPLALTGVVLGLAVLQLGVSVFSPLYGTVWIMVVAYIIGFLPYALRYTTSGLIQLSKELEEAGLTSGASWRQVFSSILFPLLAPALGGVGVFIFLISIKELAMSALLYTPNSEVLSTYLLDLWNNGNINQVSSLGSMMGVASLILAYLALRLLAPRKDIRS